VYNLAGHLKGQQCRGDGVGHRPREGRSPWKQTRARQLRPGPRLTWRERRDRGWVCVQRALDGHCRKCPKPGRGERRGMGRGCAWRTDRNQES
jgi:hypothetical protein